jgi:hypothetical protein
MCCGDDQSQILAGGEPVAGFPTLERDEGAESAGRGDESSHASPPAPALAVGVMEGTKTPTADGNLMRISHGARRFKLSH